MEEKFTKTIELFEGVTARDSKSGEEVTHKKVTFGKRLTTGDIINLDNDPQAQNRTQYQDLIRRRMIVEFGTMKMPVPLNVLLSLDSLDREDLAKAADEFLRESAGDITGEFRKDHSVRLPFGFEIDGTIYNIVQFGNRLTGRDEVAADEYGTGVGRECYMLSRQISKISTEDGLASIDGQVEFENFHALDAADLNFLRVGAQLWRESFRQERKKLSRERNGDGSVSADAGNKDERGGNTEPAEREA